MINSLYIHNLESISVQVTVVEFKSVLHACPNLKQLDTSIDLSYFRKEELKRNLPKLELDCLSYSKDPEYFEIFKNCTTKKLKIFLGLSRFMGNTQSIKDFLIKQKNLTDLEFWYSDRSLSLFRDDQLHMVDFRLKRFKMVGKGLLFTDFMSFERFIENHKTSLEYLDIFSCQNVIDSFANFQNLKTISLNDVQVTSEPFPHVEKLNLTSVKGQYILKFPNVKQMYINTNHLVSTDFRSLNNLKSIELSVRKIDHIKLPPVIDLKFICVTAFDTHTNLPHSIETITLKDCMNIDWFEDFMKKNKKLKHVRIIGSSITFRLAKSIRRISHVNNFSYVF